MPFSSISPSVGTYSLVSSFTKVDFPEPFAPTMHSFSSPRIVRLSPLITNLSLPGYLNDTFLNSITESAPKVGVRLPLT